MILTKDKKILIVGLGLMGGSYAQGLTEKGYIVGAIDTKESSIKYGLEKGIIASGYTEVNEQYVSEFDIIISCLYPKVFIDWINKYQSFIKKGAVLTDVTGVKTWVINEVSKIIRKDIEFICTHPMAGREVYGVENSNKDIFKGANYIITPTPFSRVNSLEIVKSIGEILEFKNIVILDHDEHDEMVGFLSQLTHCIAVSLMACKESTKLVQYTGDSFRDLTRIAKINENMWSELFLLNKDELLSQIELFQNQLEHLRKSIEEEDVDKMKEMMRLSTFRRSFFDK